MLHKRLALILAAFILLALCAACAGAAPADPRDFEQRSNLALGDTQPQATPAPDERFTDAAAEDGSVSLTNVGSMATTRKEIFTGNMEIETEDFQYSLDRIYDLIDRAGGYVSQRDITGLRTRSDGVREMRSAHFTLKIPVDQFQNFLSQSGSIGNVLFDKIDSQDVTDQYFDTEARLSTLRITEARFLAMLEQATELEKVIELERTLSDLRYQIENLTGTLRKWDALVAYCTLNITLQEVGEETPVTDPPAEKTFWQSLGETFNASVRVLVSIGKGIVVAAVAILPVLLPIALILGLVFYIVKRIATRRRKAKSLAPPPSIPAEMETEEEPKEDEDKK